jgi:hypothetical protein
MTSTTIASASWGRLLADLSVPRFAAIPKAVYGSIEMLLKCAPCRSTSPDEPAPVHPPTFVLALIVSASWRSWFMVSVIRLRFHIPARPLHPSRASSSSSNPPLADCSTCLPTRCLLLTASKRRRSTASPADLAIPRVISGSCWFGPLREPLGDRGQARNGRPPAPRVKPLAHAITCFRAGRGVPLSDCSTSLPPPSDCWSCRPSSVFWLFSSSASHPGQPSTRGRASAGTENPSTYSSSAPCTIGRRATPVPD